MLSLRFRNLSFVLVLTAIVPSAAQHLEGSIPVTDADSLYIKTFTKRNDARIFYGGQANELVFGSLRDGSPDMAQNIYKNTNDFIGVGLSYQWIDGDLTFALPGTTYLKEERSNLEQFKLSISHTRRNIVYRAHFSDSKGIIASGNSGEYASSPSLHQVKAGVQTTFILNSQKYSYRAALYQNELQLKTAGSLLFSAEFFFRDLGSNGSPVVPEEYDTEARFGEQIGLTYLRAPGLLFMPGYGVNFVFDDSRFFVSPILLAGAGLALNSYRGEKGHSSQPNMEYNVYFLMNAGYNGNRFYGRASFTYDAGYSPLQPAYLTSTSLVMRLVFGVRLSDFLSK